MRGQSVAAKRIIAIDAARGCAMVLVCLSHIKQHFEVTAPSLYWLFVNTTRIATPTFLLLSGFVIGYLLRTDTRARTGVSLIDRALFLLIVAHPLLGLQELQEQGVQEWLFGRASITDAIAVALMLAVLLRRAAPRTLIALGISMCALSWVVSMTLTFGIEWVRNLAVVLFHSAGVSSGALDAPVIPYVGVFLIGMGLSGRLHAPLVRREDQVITHRLLVFGSCALVLTAIGIIAWHFGKILVADPDTAALLRQTLDPRSKWPPSPGYLLFYGGLGLLLLAMFFNGEPARLVGPLARVTSVIGRASLMCFVVQDWLFALLPAALGFNEIASLPFWFAYLALCLIVLYMLARVWDNANGNRFLTVGLKAWNARRRAALTPPAPKTLPPVPR